MPQSESIYFRIMPVLVLVLLVLSSCTLFETREPDPPDSGAGTPFIQPDRAEIVLQNLENAVKDLNVRNYLNCLNEETFTYQPTGEAQNSDPDLWSGWGFASEENYFNNLRSSAQSGSGNSLQLSNIESETLSSTEQQISVNYVLNVNHNRNTDGIPVTAQGRMILYLVAGDDGLWSISGWTDLSTSGEFSWSDMRSTFY